MTDREIGWAGGPRRGAAWDAFVKKRVAHIPAPRYEEEPACHAIVGDYMGRTYYKLEDRRIWSRGFSNFRGEDIMHGPWETTSYLGSNISQDKFEAYVRKWTRNGGLVFYSTRLQVPPRRTRAVPWGCDETPLK